MKEVTIPKELLAVEIAAGRVSVGSTAGMGGAVGAMGAVASHVAESGLRKAAAGVAAGNGLSFPPCCCNCLRSGRQVSTVESVSVINRGLPYSFRFAIPHCSVCSASANRKRLGLMGYLAAFLALSVLIGIAAAVVGGITDRQWLFEASLIIGPLCALALLWVWNARQKPRPGQASRYQAVYASRLELDLSGVPGRAVLAFANDAYADRFVAANRDLGVVGS